MQRDGLDSDRSSSDEDDDDDDDIVDIVELLDDTDTEEIDKQQPEVNVYESLDDLDNSYNDISRRIVLPLPYAFVSLRFNPVGQLERHFVYRVRQTFRPLAKKVLRLFNGVNHASNVIRYVGNVGAGKSHNLAALCNYLRVRSAKQWGFELTAVYISSCALLFQSPASRLQTVLIDAFPADTDEIAACDDWNTLAKFVKKKQPWSIIFIFDDWNFVEPKAQDTLKTQLLELSYDQYRIEAISAGSETLTNTSSVSLSAQPCTTEYLYLLGGLTAPEWQTWKQKSDLFRDISEEDEVLLCNLTGLVPLYLNDLERCRKVLQFLNQPVRRLTLSERMLQFQMITGGNIHTLLEATSEAYCSAKPAGDDTLGYNHSRRYTFVKQMTYALAEIPQSSINESLYDHRFFFVCSDTTAGCILKPVCGLVRTLMRDYLDKWHTSLYRERITPSWINDALKYGRDPSVKRFAFEEYALLHILRHPSQYLGLCGGVVHEDDPSSSSLVCELVRFDGKIDELNTSGLTMYWPTKMFTHHVDAVLRYVVPEPAAAAATSGGGGGGGSSSRKRVRDSRVEHSGPHNIRHRRRSSIVKIFAVQVTLQTPLNHKGSTPVKFFSQLPTDKGLSETYLYSRERASAERYLIWVGKHGGHDHNKVGKHGGHDISKVCKHGGHDNNKVCKHGGHDHNKVCKHGGHDYNKVCKHGGHDYNKVCKHGGHDINKFCKHGGHDYNKVCNEFPAAADNSVRFDQMWTRVSVSSSTKP